MNFLSGARGRTRTCHLQSRKLTLYPDELREHSFDFQLVEEDQPTLMERVGWPASTTVPDF
jgi:hypothetical protein